MIFEGRARLAPGVPGLSRTPVRQRSGSVPPGQPTACDFELAVAGAGTATKLRAAGRLAAKYGRAADGWARMASSAFGVLMASGSRQTGYDNVLPGGQFEIKTKFHWMP